jgi:sensor histidine kinase YesM
VENCILHGLAEAPARGRIGIAARVEADALPAAAPPEAGVIVVPGRRLVIEVRDDGAGMDEARLASVMEDEARSGGLYRIGVANVRRRIALNFGEPYGLSMESSPGAGTLVRFILPFMKRVEETEGEDRA